MAADNDILLELAESLDDYGDELSALTFHAGSLAKELDVTEEQIAHALSLFDGIHY